MELEQERLRVRDSKSLNTRILAELHDAVGLIQDPPKLKETVRAMYEKFGRFEGEFIKLVISEVNHWLRYYNSKRGTRVGRPS